MDDTEADVKSWTETVAAKLRGAPDPGKDWWAALRLLEAAALEGAKVPGLVADNAVLYSLVRRAIYGKGDGSCTECGRKGGCAPDCEMAKEAAKHRPGATLLGELSALQAQVEDAEDRWKVAEAARKLALEQVATLERQGLDMARQVGELSGEVATLTAERDAAIKEVGLKEAQRETAFRIGRKKVAEKDAANAVRDALRAQVDAVREKIASHYSMADVIARDWATPTRTPEERTSYLIRDALTEVRSALDCRQDCDRWHGGKHSWE